MFFPRFGVFHADFLVRVKYETTRSRIHEVADFLGFHSLLFPHTNHRGIKLSTESPPPLRSPNTLVDDERETGIWRSNLSRSIHFFMSQPSAEVRYNSLSRKLTETIRTVTLDTGPVNVNALYVNVYPGGVRIEEAEFFITCIPEETFWTHVNNVLKQQFLNSPRFVTSVSWESHQGPMVISGNLQLTGVRVEDHEKIAKAIRHNFYSQMTLTLKPGVGRFAIPLFTIEGHDNAYLTDGATPIALGQNYTLIVSIAGLNLPETQRIWFRVELSDWNHIRVSRDTVFRRVLRKARFLF